MRAQKIHAKAYKRQKREGGKISRGSASEEKEKKTGNKSSTSAFESELRSATWKKGSEFVKSMRPKGAPFGGMKDSKNGSAGRKVPGKGNQRGKKGRK
jgi:hypothetical protein